MKRLLRLLATVVAGFVLAVPLTGASLAPAAVPGTAPAGVQDFSFDSYSADYYLSRDGEGHATLRTVETFVAQFPSFDQNRGIIRAIPNDYDGVPLHTSVESVVDQKGAPVYFEATDTGSFTELALGDDDYVHGKTTYVISYTQQNVVRAFADTGDDEFYWDTNGTGFNQPFGTVSARVHIDPSIAEFLTGNNACYQGAQGASDQCEITQSQDAGGTVLSSSVRNLGPGENLTVVVGFLLDTFVQVPPEERPVDPGNSGGPFPQQPRETPWWGTFGSIMVMVLAGLGTVFTAVRRFLGPRDAKGRGIIIPQYTVPKGINLLESAEIIKRQSAGLPAQLVSFAVRGKIRILDYPVSKSGAQYTLQLLTAEGVDAQERALLMALFGSGLEAGEVREIGVTDDPLATAIAGVRGRVGPAVIARGFKAKRSSLGGILTSGAMFLLIFAAFGLMFVSSFVGGFSGWGFFSIFVVFICFFLTVAFSVRSAVLTEAGAEQRDYLLGMRDYLQLAEADRFRMLQSPQGAERVRAEGLDVNDKAQVVKLYEKLLPFAVLWGIEREWAKELTVFYESTAATPDWFVTNGTFNAVLFSQALGGLSNSVATSSTPTPTPSSWSGSSGGSFSGGSFGGGFSGGGGGGGGGGGR